MKNLYLFALALTTCIGCDVLRLPEDIARDYLEYLKARKYRSAYSLLSKKARAHIDFISFSNYQKWLEGSGEAQNNGWKVTDIIEPRKESRAAGHVDVLVALAKGNYGGLQYLFMVREARGWRVSHIGTLDLKADFIKYGADLQGRADISPSDHEKLVKLYEAICEIRPWYTKIKAELAEHYEGLAVSKKRTGQSWEIPQKMAVRIAQEVLRAEPNNRIARAILARQGSSEARYDYDPTHSHSMYRQNRDW